MFVCMEKQLFWAAIKSIETTNISKPGQKIPLQTLFINSSITLTTPQNWRKESLIYFCMRRYSCNMIKNSCFSPPTTNYFSQNFFNINFLYPSWLLLKFYCCFHCLIMGGIPPPSRGIVGKNRSARSKTTVGSKRVCPLKVGRGPHYRFPTVLTIYVGPMWAASMYCTYTCNILPHKFHLCLIFVIITSLSWAGIQTTVRLNTMIYWMRKLTR